MNLKGYRYPKELILLSVHWYLKYPLSYRNLEEMLGERGMRPDHSSVYRWVQTFTPRQRGPLDAFTALNHYQVRVVSGGSCDVGDHASYALVHQR